MALRRSNAVLRTACREQLRVWTGHLHLSPEQAAQARVLAARTVARLAPNSKIAFAFSQGSDGLVAQMQGRSQPAFLIARSPLDDVGFGRDQSFSFAMRHQVGRTGLSLSAEHGSAMVSLFYRRDAGHFAELPDDKGIAASGRGSSE